MTNTNDFISLLASKLGRSTPNSTPALVVFDVPSYQVPDQERATTFLNNWQALGGKGGIVKSPDEAVGHLQEWFGNLFLDQPKQPTIVSWNLLPAFAESAFSSLNWPLVRYPQSAPAPHDRHMLAAQAELGVTGADWALPSPARLSRAVTPNEAAPSVCFLHDI